MYRLLAFFLGSLLLLEGVYHISIFGFVGMNPLLMLPVLVLVAIIDTIVVRIFKKRNVNLAIMWVCMSLNYLLYAVQLVYFNIFTRPLLIDVAITTGGEALTDFWSVAVDGIFRSIVPLIIMMIPFVVGAILLRKNVLKLKRYHRHKYIEGGIIAAMAVSLYAFVVIFNYVQETEAYKEYQEMYAPEELAKQYGVFALFQRDLMGDILPELEVGEVVLPIIPDVDPGKDSEDTEGKENPSGSEDTSGSEIESGETTESETETATEDPGPTYDTSPNIFNIDFDKLLDKGDKSADKLVSYLQQMTPSNKNEYTGMFEGYNLIYITAEAFSPYIISEELTPTLYKLANSGFVVEDYYVPLGQTSTSDGEYMNLMGQIPSGSHSFRNSQDNTYPYSLPAYFAKEGVKSYAYHSNSLSYYDRYLTHPNLGYQFKAAKYGKSSLKDKYSDWIFDMKGSGKWPNSDYEMFVATIPEFINEERFHTYYMTLSGHAAYTWTGNAMSSKNKEAVAHLDCSDSMKAYIACNLELEKAMAYLLEELEKAGKLESTVIVLSADHHPYGLAYTEADGTKVTAEDIIGEYIGREIDSIELQKNTLILWNSQMETVKVDKTCCSVDIIPTILNLFGFEYDSRLFAGRDMLSDSPSLVVFSNKSFITDYVIYNSSTKKTTLRTDVEVGDDYVKSMKSYVDIMIKYSSGMLKEDFHNLVNQCVIPETNE